MVIYTVYASPYVTTSRFNKLLSKTTKQYLLLYTQFLHLDKELCIKVYSFVSGLAVEVFLQTS